MDGVDVANHRKLIEKMVEHYIDAQIEIVPDIAEWCAANSGGQYVASELDNPIGKARWNSPTEPNRVLLRSQITGQQLEDHLLALYLKGFKDVYCSIQDETTFLKHLVLHEVAHIKHDWRQENEMDCDRWAFEQLNQWVET